ncbi:Heparanase-like protein 3 [Sesamum angolense]|uniref:Heparanase-like protein 3 n=1 Tax=Sesamum angolense TaxID=2727404 RepID=A0AAE1WDY0_9LAMI|nr:Heparanase-like protein 3 [Sesamum angolense]
MGSFVLPMGWWVLVCVLWFGCIGDVKAGETVEGIVFVDGKTPIAKTDEDFICATLDWWPPEKCDYGTCSWGHASLLNLDLKNSVFLNAVKAFSPLKIRLGGTLQDKVIYQTEDKPEPCIPFAKNSSQMFGFTGGCLPLVRWDELNSFFNQSGALVIFGLNALKGKAIQPNNTATGPWDSSNAASLIRYTVKRGYNIYAWELGNELSGTGIGVGIDVNTYASDTIVLHDLIYDIYKEVNAKPQIIAPGGFFDPGWFQQFLAKTVGSLNVITHHIYNLGPGSDEHLIDRILNPTVLDNGGDVFRNLHNVIRTSANSATAWVGEAGGAYNSGRNGVTNAFVFSFWYLDQLGLASTYDTKTYCRQTLIGGNYGLLNTTTFAPNPDYYRLSNTGYFLLTVFPFALLLHKFPLRVIDITAMFKASLGSFPEVRPKCSSVAPVNGKKCFVNQLFRESNAPCIRSLRKAISRRHPTSHKHRWEHDCPCPKVDFNRSLTSLRKHRHHRHRSTATPLHNKQVSGKVREEYHLTPTDGNIQSRTVLLNGKALTVDSSGLIPVLEPVRVNSSEPIRVAPYSVVFVHMPNAAVPACR